MTTSKESFPLFRERQVTLFLSMMRAMLDRGTVFERLSQWQMIEGALTLEQKAQREEALQKTCDRVLVKVGTTTFRPQEDQAEGLARAYRMSTQQLVMNCFGIKEKQEAEELSTQLLSGLAHDADTVYRSPGDFGLVLMSQLEGGSKRPGGLSFALNVKLELLPASISIQQEGGDIVAKREAVLQMRDKDGRLLEEYYRMEIQTKLSRRPDGTVVCSPIRETITKCTKKPVWIV